MQKQKKLWKNGSVSDLSLKVTVKHPLHVRMTNKLFCLADRGVHQSDG